MSKEHHEIENRLWQQYWHCRDSGDLPTTRKARNDLVLFYVEGNESLVQRIARRMISIGQFKMEDRESALIALINEGTVPFGNRQEGLIYAIEHYNGSIPFEAYAYDLVRYSILHDVTADPEQGQHVNRFAREYKKYLNRFTNEFQRDPRSLQELANFLGISLKRIASRQMAYFFIYQDSLMEPDENIGEEDSGRRSPTNSVFMTKYASPTPEEEFFRNMEIDDLKKAMSVLKPRELQTLIMRYVEDQTDDEIASSLDIKPGNVRVILSRAVHKLRAVSI